MTLFISSFNIWAILVCILSNMIIGALWYSQILFGNVWMKLLGKTIDDFSKEDSNKAMSISLIPAAFSIIFLALILQFTRASTWIDGLLIASLMSVGFIGMSAFNLVLFEERSFKLSLINIGYSFVSFNIAAIILTLWK